MVTRTGTGRAPDTGSNRGNAGSEFNAGPMSPDRACELVMNAEANMDNPGLLRVLRKPRGSEPGKFPEVEQSRGHTGPGGRAGLRNAESRQQPASPRQEAGGAGSVHWDQGRSASHGVDHHEAPVVQVGVPVDSLQTGGTQVAQGLGHPEEVGVRRSSRQRSKIIPSQAGTGGMKRQMSDRLG